MRRALACLLILTALATPAGARQSARTTAVAPSASPPAPDTRNPILPVPLPLAADRQGRDPGQCRAACAKAYYFCAAAGDDDGCGGQWAQCKSRCTATYTRLGG